MKSLPSRHLKVNGIWFDQCREHENIDKFIGKNPFSKYYKDLEKEFWFFACHVPVPGYVYCDKDVGFLKDFRTPERYREYKDCGLNVLYLQANNNGYNGEDFETSELKKNLDDAKKGGIDKVIVTDMRLHALSAMKEPIVGENKAFKTYQDLVEYVKACVKPYKDYDNGLVVGLMLRDEPTVEQLPQACMVFKAITDAWKGCFVDLCLLPFDNGIKGLYDNVTELDSVESAYENYVDNYFKWTGAKHIMMDSYPLRVIPAKNGGYLHHILTSHFRGLQMLTAACKKYGATLCVCSNTCELSADREGKDLMLEWPNEDQMYWQNNAYMIFGAKQYEYYTYWSKTINSKGCYHVDKKAFISLDGERTEMYYFMQRMHQEMQRFAKVFMNFEYQKVQYFKKERAYFSTNYLNFDESAEDFGNLSFVKVVDQRHSCVSMITELKDQTNDQVMYAVFNPDHPANGEYYYNSCTITLEFDSRFRAVEIWYKGEMITMGLNNGKLSISLDAGYAAYILPYL